MRLYRYRGDLRNLLHYADHLNIPPLLHMHNLRNATPPSTPPLILNFFVYFYGPED